MNCKPCIHAQRDFIDADLIHGRPLRAISAEYGCSLGSLSRHREHVRELIREHVTGDRAERGSNLLNRVEKLVGQAEEILATAKSEKNYRACTSALIAAGRLLELCARLSGEIHAANAPGIHFTQQIQVNSYAYGDDRELATLVGEATNGFDVDEFMRLERLVLGDNSGTAPNEEVQPLKIEAIRQAR